MGLVEKEVWRVGRSSLVKPVMICQFCRRLLLRLLVMEGQVDLVLLVECQISGCLLLLLLLLLVLVLLQRQLSLLMLLPLLMCLLQQLCSGMRQLVRLQVHLPLTIVLLLLLLLLDLLLLQPLQQAELAVRCHLLLSMLHL